MPQQDYWRYGIGERLLSQMGWAPGMFLGVGNAAALNPVIEQEEPDDSYHRHRAGVGYRARPVAEPPPSSFRGNVRRVHNYGVRHVGKVRTYARLRKLPGFPWGLTTSEVYKNVKDECV